MEPRVIARSGAWRIERFCVEHNQAELDAIPELYIPPGEYTRLMHSERAMIMSDIPFELGEQKEFVRKACGKIHINGLGLGLIVDDLLLKPEVTEITVVEIDSDVIALVGSKYAGQRVEIILADAETYLPPSGAYFDAVWHDFWDCFWDEQAKQLEALFARWKPHCGWQAAWGPWAMGILKRGKAC